MARMVVERARPILITLGLTVSLSVMPAFAQNGAGASLDRRCAALANLQLPDAQITLAEAIRPQPSYMVPGTERNQGGPVTVDVPFCRVAGTVKPAIRFEVWMPLENWNGRFQGMGSGALLGAILHQNLAQSVSRGYAAGVTNNGHDSAGNDATWALDAQGRLKEGLLADFAHRGVHEMTVKSKQIISAFYGEGPRYSYFTGCSSGGHQALTQAQRHPENYDGILAGAPANYWTHLMAGQLWYGLATRVDPATNLEQPVNKLPLINGAVLAACDARDGVRDGVIENPQRCGFEPASLACRDGQDPATCLTPPQVRALEKIHGDAQTPGGRKIFPGLARGSELAWPTMSARQVAFAETFYRYFVFQNPAWNYATMDFARDVDHADRRIGHIVNSTNPDLSRFRARGGKLIQYHGWNDWGISPYNSIDYYESVVAATAPGADRNDALRETQQFHRLFMVPGMEHCRGGAGTDTFDGLEALQRWVEEGVAPRQIIASKVQEGRTVRTRPLCPYPQVAHYEGRGSTDDAASFECRL